MDDWIVLQNKKALNGYLRQKEVTQWFKKQQEHSNIDEFPSTLTTTRLT